MSGRRAARHAVKRKVFLNVGSLRERHIADNGVPRGAPPLGLNSSAHTASEPIRGVKKDGLWTPYSPRP